MADVQEMARIINETNEKEEIGRDKKYEIDELGLGVADTPDYIAARALLINARELEKDPSVGLLHTRKRGTELWKGNELLPRGGKTIYRLARLNRRLREYEIDAIWESILKNSPELDETKIVVDDSTYWDTESGELVHTDKKMITI